MDYPNRRSSLNTFVQDYRLKDTDLTKTFYLGVTGLGVTGFSGYTGFSGVTGLPGVDHYQPPYPVSPYWVAYEIDYIEPVAQYPIRVGPFNRVPLQTLWKNYYANFIVGEKWATGYYQIVWKSIMTGDTGIPMVESIDNFEVVTACIYGTTGSSGITGPYNWYSDIYGTTGTIGSTGITPPPTPGETGTQPYSFIPTTYNAISRYMVVSTAGAEVWVTSNAPSYDGLTWARYGSILNISQANHGMTVGDRVIVRNTNLDFQNTVVTAVTVNSFSVGVTDAGYLQGYAGSYSRGFNYSHTGSPKTGGVLTTASADVKLLSLRIRTGTRSSTTYTLTTPSSALNDSSTSMGTSFIPMLSVRQDSDNLSAVAGTIAVNYAGSYSNFQIANLGNPAASRLIVLMFG